MCDAKTVRGWVNTTHRLHTCGASCCVYVGGGGDEIWSGGLSHLGTRSWRSQSLFSAPWSFAGRGGRTECRASTTVSHPPSDKKKKRHFKTQEKDQSQAAQVCIAPTFLLPSSLRSKAHCCLHCSHVCGGPYFFSELVQRWHLVPMKAAMMLQYWQGLGCKTNTHENNANVTLRKRCKKLD